MNTPTLLTGIVLCGGKSSRMGTDKGLLQKDGKTWTELAYDKLTTLGLPVKLSVNEHQLETYSKLFDPALFIKDQISLHGPLAGLLTAHSQAVDSDLLLLACDITDISIPTIQELINAYQELKNEYDFFVFQQQGEWEPLLGIYTSGGLKKIYTLYEQGDLKKNSMKNMLEISNTFSISLSEEQKKEFRNYNEIKDLGNG